MKKRLKINVDFLLQPMQYETDDQMFKRLEGDLERLKNFVEEYFSLDSGKVIIELEDRDAEV